MDKKKIFRRIWCLPQVLKKQFQSKQIQMCWYIPIQKIGNQKMLWCSLIEFRHSKCYEATSRRQFIFTMKPHFLPNATMPRLHPRDIKNSGDLLYYMRSPADIVVEAREFYNTNSFFSSLQITSQRYHIKVHTVGCQHVFKILIKNFVLVS